MADFLSGLVVFTLVWLFIFKFSYGKLRNYVIKHKKIFIVFLIVMSACIMYAVQNNAVSILHILKYKNTASWFSAIGTVAATFVALLPQIMKLESSDILFQVSVEKVDAKRFRVKYEITNFLDKLEKIKIENSSLEFFVFKPDKYKLGQTEAYSEKDSLISQSFRHNVNSGDGPEQALYLPAFGKKQTIYYSEPIVINIIEKYAGKDIDYHEDEIDIHKNTVMFVIQKAKISVKRDKKNYYAETSYDIENYNFYFEHRHNVENKG